MANIESIPVKKIKTLKSVQPRETIDAERVGDFVSLLEENPDFEFPPIDIFRDPATGELVLADGFTRHQAYDAAKRKRVPCDVHEGDEKAAQWHALFANIRHGTPLTREERKQVIYRALDHPGRNGIENIQLAELLGVSLSTLNRAISDRKLERTKKVTPKRDEGFSKEMLAVIDKIGKCNSGAKEALLIGSIRKPEDELIAYSEFDCETQLRLAPLFFAANMSLRNALSIMAKRPNDPHDRMERFLHYAMKVGVNQCWTFFDDTIEVCVTLLRETTPEEMVTPAKNGATAPEPEEELI